MPDESPHTWTMTSTQLLDGLRDVANATTWQVYVDRYRPMVVRYAKQLGAREDEAEDLAQVALMAFAQAYRDGRYDRERGRLRSWMFGIAHRQILNGLRRRRPEVQIASEAGEADFFERLEAREYEAVWDREWRDAALQHCLELVQREVAPATWEAFDLFACRDWSAQQVAGHLGITENAVFGAKRRVMERLRELRNSIDDLW